MTCFSYEELLAMAMEPTSRACRTGHLEECPTCRRLLAQAREEVGLMRSAIRSLPARGEPTCPEEEVLALYLDGVFSGQRQEDLETHFAACATCRETLADMHAALQYVLHSQCDAGLDAAGAESANGSKASSARFWRRAQ